MIVDWTISIGAILQVASIIIGGLLALAALRASVSELQKDVSAMQTELKKMGDILTSLAVTETRIDNMDTRVSVLERDARDLRRGEGFIRGHRGIDGEYGA